MTNDCAIEQQRAEAAFSKQAPVFDALYNDNTIIRYKRQRVREHVQSFLPASSSILELNAGTGEDAIYFAQQGHRVHATDFSTGMEIQLKEKVQNSGCQQFVTFERCSFIELDSLKQQGPYDLVFSNFAGLNCTSRLDKVLLSLPSLIKPGGYATLVVLPKFCLWEFLLLFKGHFKTAFRRFSGSRGSKAHIEGEYFRCWYYNPSYIRKRVRNDFDIVAVEGLCTIVPPSYIEHFAEKRPRWYAWLVKRENKWKSRWPWRSIGDYYIITLKRK